MIGVYSVFLALGLLGLLAWLAGGPAPRDASRGARPGPWRRPPWRTATASSVGFGMAGLSAEFSPLDLSWQAALAIAVLGAVLSAAWAWAATRITG